MKRICQIGLLIIVCCTGCNMLAEDSGETKIEVSENEIIAIDGDGERDEASGTASQQEGMSIVSEKANMPLYEGDNFLWTGRHIIGVSENVASIEIYQDETIGEVISGDGMLFYYKTFTTGGSWSGTGEPYQEKTQVYAMPLDGREPYLLASLNTIERLSLDYYEDTLCVALYEGDRDGYREWYFQEDENSTYVWIKEYEPIDFTHAQEYGYSRFAGQHDWSNLFLRNSKLSECNGRVLLWNEEEEKAGIFDCNGNLQCTYEDMESIFDLSLLSERYLLKQSEGGAYLYDLETQAEEKISDNPNLFHVMLQDNKIYYKTSEQVDSHQLRFSDEEVIYYCYDIDTTTTIELVSTIMPCGTDYPYFIYDRIIYYVDFEPDGRIYKWMWCDLTTEETTEGELGVIEYQDGFPKYGSLNKECIYTVCPDCGETIWYACKDEFRFDDSIASADIMNEFLASMEEAHVSQEYGDAVLRWHDCEFLNREYNSWVLVDLVEIGDRYFSLDYSAYSDQQRAMHGNHAREFFLLDTLTGENVTIKDLFGGTEEELNQIAAEHAVEIYRETGTARWTNGSEEEVYQDIYNHTIQEIKFCEDGAMLFYDTSYASGSFYTILIPYEELGLDYLYGN